VLASKFPGAAREPTRADDIRDVGLAITRWSLDARPIVVPLYRRGARSAETMI